MLNVYQCSGEWRVGDSNSIALRIPVVTESIRHRIDQKQLKDGERTAIGQNKAE